MGYVQVLHLNFFYRLTGHPVYLSFFNNGVKKAPYKKDSKVLLLLKKYTQYAA
jgi:hypothetical protein